jgi:plasmid stabilization system protein ParE
MSQKFAINVTAEAHRDLQEIDDYIFLSSPQNASLVATRIWAEIDSLGTFPRRANIFEANEDPDEIVHSLSASSFIIYYRVIESTSTVEVLTIRRGARDRPRRFFPK